MKEYVKSIVLFVAIVVIFWVGIVFINQDGTKKEFYDEYNKIEAEIADLWIAESAKIRSEPIVIENSGDGCSNSFGKLKEEWDDIPITRLYRMDEALDERNGRFLGFIVEDIEAIPEWDKYFPKSITDDPDGIVWVSVKYVNYYLVKEAPH